MKTRLLTLICVSALVLFTCLLQAQGDKMIYQELLDIDGGFPEEGTIEFVTYFTERPFYAIEGPDPDIGFNAQLNAARDRFLISFNANTFTTRLNAPPWQPANTLRIEIWQTTSDLMVNVEFPIAPGNNPQRRFDEEAVYLRPPPATLFDSNLRDDDDEFVFPVTTTATLMDEFDPSDDGVYRANNWGHAGRYYQVQFSTEGASDLYMQSQVKRQYQGPAGAHARGPRYFTTYYSIDGQEWTPYGNPEVFDDDHWWTFLNNEEDFAVHFPLPEECEDQETVYIRWYHLHDWGELNQNGWLEIKDILVSGERYFDLEIDVVGNGTSSPLPDTTHTYLAGSTLYLEAIEDTDGWIFDRWVIEEAEFDTIHVRVTLDRNIEATVHFRQFPSPNPTVAINPNPADDSTGVSLDLEEIQWTYNVTHGYTNPVGFRVYMNMTGEFGEDDDFEWVAYVEDQTRYSNSDIFPDEFLVGRTYYWQVIPTTDHPDRNNDRSRRYGNNYQRQKSILRGDAENCPVWSFTMESTTIPDIARNPYPVHDSVGVSIDLERVSWDYIVSEQHANPLGFRIYGGTDPDFDEEEFGWVPYVDNQVRYSIEHGFELEYATKYYWQVIPTTTDPNGGRSSGRQRQNSKSSQRQLFSYRGDAVNSPIWSCTIELNPIPAIAANPIPADDSTDVALDLEHLSWDFVVDTLRVNPLGFRVYMNTTGEFGEDDDFQWVEYIEDQLTYTASDILPDNPEYFTDYYWQVIPTTIDPNDDRSENRKRSARYGRMVSASTRGDAEDSPVWMFTTINVDPNPIPAVNPDPEHQAIDIAVALEELSWEYFVSPDHAYPLGFRVYFGTDPDELSLHGNFVEYEEGEENYSLSRVHAPHLDYNSTYYWKVVPTTKENGDGEGHDALDCPVWSFTTEIDTSVDEDDIAILITEDYGNFPNPFNPNTTIRFAISEPGTVTLEIFNSRGQRVVNLINNHLERGQHSVVWDSRDENRREVGSGLYFYRLNVMKDSGDSYQSLNKMLLIK